MSTKPGALEHQHELVREVQRHLDGVLLLGNELAVSPMPMRASRLSRAA